MNTVFAVAIWIIGVVVVLAIAPLVVKYVKIAFEMYADYWDKCLETHVEEDDDYGYGQLWLWYVYIVNEIFRSIF